MSRSSEMGMNGPSSPKLTWYRLSLYRCGSKRMPECREKLSRKSLNSLRTSNVDQATPICAVVLIGARTSQQAHVEIMRKNTHADPHENNRILSARKTTQHERRHYEMGRKLRNENAVKTSLN